MSVVEKRGPLKHYSPSKKNIYERYAVLKGMQFALWTSEKDFGKGKAPVENVSLNYGTQVNPLGRKMGKNFCIHVLTSGRNEAFWAKNTDDQNAWVDALRRACKRPEEPKQGLVIHQQAPQQHQSKQDIQIQVQVPSDPNLQYQQQMMQQQQMQYQQQMALYQQQLQQYQQYQQQMMQQQGGSGSQAQMLPPPPQPPMPQMQAYPQAQASPQMPRQPSPQPGGLHPNVNDPNYWTYDSPAASPSMSRARPPPPDSGNSNLKSSPYGRF